MDQETSIIPGGPGIKTSEFLSSSIGIAANLIGVLVIMGIIPKNDQEPLSTAIASVITGGCMVFANAVIVWNYIKTRMALKAQASENIRDAAFHISQVDETPAPCFIPDNLKKMNLSKLWPMAKPWMLMVMKLLNFLPGGAKAKVVIEAVMNKIDEIIVSNPNI